MNREKLKDYIWKTYHVKADHPWNKYPGNEVFRHGSNQKWFALIMDVENSKLGLQGDSLLDIVNVKCDSVLIGSLLMETGFFPAYHMNKNNWITIALDDSASDDRIKMLLDMSYKSTERKECR